MIEKFSPGDKVFLIHLQEEGTVTKLNGAEMVYVQLSDMEIPVYCADITRNIPESRLPAGTIQKQKSNTSEVVLKDKLQLLKKDSGIFLAFEPVTHGDKEITQFKVVLVNDTVFSVMFRYRFFLSGNIHFKLDKTVLPYEVFLLHEIAYDALNEMPEVDLHVRDAMNEVMKGDLEQKIKPQNFFNKLSAMALTGNEAYVYKVSTAAMKINVPAPVVKQQASFDLSNLKAMMMDSPGNKDAEIIDAAREVDLHIEKLVSDSRKMDNAEMLHLQLAKFQQMLDRAIAGGVDRLYIIHGNGKGKLKKEIHHLLKTYKEVKSFNNDYHPKYAFGATEIILH